VLIDRLPRISGILRLSQSNLGHSHHTQTALDSNGGAITFEDIE
jgi:hypothetical protein